jgi:hypothetical protein
MRGRSTENQRLSEIIVSIDIGTRIINKTASTLYFSYAIPLQSPPDYPSPLTPNSIIFSYGNALNLRHKPFLRTTKNRLAGPSEFCPFEIQRRISAIRNLVGFSDYRHQSVKF